MNPFIESIQYISPLSNNSIQALNSCISFQLLKKGTLLLEPEKTARNMYFIHKGLARVFYYLNANDISDYFALENQFVGAVESLFTGQPSKKGIELLEDSEVYFMSYTDMEALSLQHHDIERAGRKLITFAFLELQQRIESIRFHEAKERYKELSIQYPGLINRCPLKHIASFLGITQVSLSRLRAET